MKSSTRTNALDTERGYKVFALLCYFTVLSHIALISKCVDSAMQVVLFGWTDGARQEEN